MDMALGTGTPLDHRLLLAPSPGRRTSCHCSPGHCSLTIALLGSEEWIKTGAVSLVQQVPEETQALCNPNLTQL